MPRIARIAPGGVVFHVLNRANGRATIFDKDGDFLASERIIVRSSERVPIVNRHRTSTPYRRRTLTPTGSPKPRWTLNFRSRARGHSWAPIPSVWGSILHAEPHFCDAGSGTCIHPDKADGTACTDDGDPMSIDVCVDGSCAHVDPSPTPTETATPSPTATPSAPATATPTHTSTPTPTVTPPAEDSRSELGGSGAAGCSNGLDDDGDGLADCADPDCVGLSPCGVPAPAASLRWTIALALVLTVIAAAFLHRARQR